MSHIVDPHKLNYAEVASMGQYNFYGIYSRTAFTEKSMYSVQNVKHFAI